MKKRSRKRIVTVTYGKVSYLDSPKRVTFAELLGTGEYKGRGHFPISAFAKREDRRSAYIRESGRATFRGRYPWHNTFLGDNASGIRTFADIGPGLPGGAPTTVEAREILPQTTKVMAVDIVGNFDNPDLRGRGIKMLKHSIVDGQLPEPVDAIRFAQVSRYLTGYERRRALRNIHSSLPEGGFLMSDNHIYQKTKRGFELIALQGVHWI